MSASRTVLELASPTSARRYLTHYNTFPRLPKDVVGKYERSRQSDTESEPSRDVVQIGRTDWAAELPDDCWLHIFTFFSSATLTRVQRVCTKFQELAQDPSLWATLDIRPCGQNTRPESMARLLFLRCGPQVTQVSLSGAECVSDTHIALLASKCPQLDTLDLSWCVDITDEALFAVAESCHRLRRIKLNHCRKVTSVGLMAISSLNTLVSFTAGFCYTADGPWSKGVVTSRSVQELDLRHCIRLPVASFMCIGGMARLRVLVLRGCLRLTDEALMRILVMCENLEELDISCCRHINEALIRSPPPVTPGDGLRLRSLSMKDCYLIDDAFLRSLQGRMPLLQSCDLSNCFRVTDDGLRAIAIGSPKIKVLRLSGCRKVTDAGIADVTAEAHNLEHIVLDHCVEVTALGIRTISANCAQLRSLSLCDCYQVTDDFLRGFVLGEGAKSVSVLLLRNCFRLGDMALVSISLGCPSLRTLDITNCDKIGVVGLCAIADACKNLCSLISHAPHNSTIAAGRHRSMTSILAPSAEMDLWKSGVVPLS